MVSALDPELIFEVIQHHQGGYTASCLNARIETGGSTLLELHDNLSTAVERYFIGRTVPPASSIHLMLFRD